MTRERAKGEAEAAGIEERGIDCEVRAHRRMESERLSKAREKGRRSGEAEGETGGSTGVKKRVVTAGLRVFEVKCGALCER